MSEYSVHAPDHAHHVSSPISVPWVVVASILCSVGLTLLWWGLMTISWPYFVVGPLVVLAGTVMLLNPRAGWDHA
jgi:hypothetical protein